MINHYEKLNNVLGDAFNQASSGKGKERHAQDLPFDQQPMRKIVDLVGVGFALGQAIKKAQESLRMEPDAAYRELLGAINYLAGAALYYRDQDMGKVRVEGSVGDATNSSQSPSTSGSIGE